MNPVGRVIPVVAGPFAVAWVRSREKRYRARGAPIDAVTRASLAPHFPEEMLSTVAVARVDQIDPPMFCATLASLKFGILDLSAVRGMAYGDTVVIATANLRPADDSTTILFHELVHVAQYRVLGLRGFLRRYIRGWLENGRDYFAIPLEQHAYELQDRFAADPATPIDVLEEVRRVLDQ